MSRSFKKRALAWVDRKYRFLQKIYFRDKFMQVIFAEIWKKNTWTGKESASGPGSSLAQTKEIRRKLPIIFKKFNIKTLLDIPCGDFYWMNNTNLDALEKYIGADILSDLIKVNKKKYSTTKKIFKSLNLTRDKLPKVDLILVRDCLVHFSYDDILKSLKNIKSSSSKYILTTTFPKTIVNEDIITGYWRPLNLQKPPFSFPKPILLLNEKCTEEEGKYNDKSLGLWRIEDIVI